MIWKQFRLFSIVYVKNLVFPVAIEHLATNSVIGKFELLSGVVEGALALELGNNGLRNLL